MTRQTIALLAFATLALPGALVRMSGAAAEANPNAAIALQDALAAAQAIEEPQTRDPLLKEIACELASTGRFEQSESIAKQIRNANLRGNVFMILAGERAQAGDLAAALENVDRIDDTGSMYLRSVAIKRIAVAQARAGQVQAALETLQRDRDETSRAAAVEEVKLLGERGDRPAPTATFPPVVLRSAGDNASFAFVRLIPSMVGAGQLDTAVRVARGMRDGRLMAFLAIAEVQLARKELDGAVDSARAALDAADKPEGEARARSVLVRALAARGDLTEARRLADGPWKQPKQISRYSNAPFEIERSQNQARRAVALADLGELRSAMNVLSRSPALSEFMGLIELAENRRVAGDRAAAEQCLKDAVLVAERGRVGFYLKDLGVAQLQMGQLAAARASFARALFAHDLGPSKNRRVVVSDQARAGDVDGALRSVASIPELTVRAEALDWIATRLASGGSFSLAKDVAGRIADDSLRATVVARIAQLQARGGQVADVGKARGDADRSRDVPSPHEAMIIAYCWAETPEGAKEALAWARSLPSAEGRAGAALAVALSARGRKLPLRP